MNDQICNDLTEIFLTHIKSRSMTDVEILKDSTMVDASFSKYILDRVDFEKEQFYFTVNDWEEDRIVPAADIGTLRLFQRRELTKAINNGPLMEWVQYCRNSGIGQLGWVVEPDGEEATVKIHMSKKKTPKTRTTAPQYLAQEEFDSINSFVVDAIKKESWVTFTQYSDADKHRNILTSISFSKNNSCGLIIFNRPHPTRYGDMQESSYLIDPPARNAFKSLIFSTGYICSFQDISNWVRDCAQQGVKLINKDGVHYDFEVDGEDDETEEQAHVVNEQKSEEEIAEIVGKILKAGEGCTAKTTARVFLYTCLNEVTMLNFDPKTGRILTPDGHIFFKDIDVLQVMVGDKLQDRVTLTNQELKMAIRLANKPKGKAKKMKAEDKGKEKTLLDLEHIYNGRREVTLTRADGTYWRHTTKLRYGLNGIVFESLTMGQQFIPWADMGSIATEEKDVQILKESLAAFVADGGYMRRLVDATENGQATASILDYDTNPPDIPTSYTPSAENKVLLQKFDTVVRALTSERRILAKVVRETGCSLSGNLNELNLESMTYTLNCEYPLAQVRAMDLVIEMGAKQDEGILFSGADFKILQGLVSVRVREQLSMAVAAEFAQKKLHNRDYCRETLNNRLTDLEVELRGKRKGAVEGTLSLLAGPVTGITLIDLYLKTNGGLKYQDANCVHNEYRVVSFDKIESLQTPALGEYPVLGAHLVKYAEDCTNMARMSRNHRYLEEAYGATYARSSSEPGFTTDYAAGGLTNPCVEIPGSYNESARGRTRPETENACTCVCPCCGGQKTTATTHLNNINQNKGNNFMKSLTNMFGDTFGGPIGSAKSVGIDARTDMMTGNVIINQNGKYIAASVVRDKVSLTSVPKGMTFGGMPVFVFPVPISQLKQNDIIVRDTNEILVVHSIQDDVIVALSLDKQEKIEVVPVGTVFLPGVKLVRKLTPLLGNLGNMFGAPAAPAGQTANPMGGMNPLMMVMMAGGFGKDDGDKTNIKSSKGGSSDDESENGDMMQMMLMSQMMGGQQAQGGMNPMMMAMMMNKGESGGDNMMQNMLMMQMMNGGNGMFGGNPSAIPNEPQSEPDKGGTKKKA